MRMSEDINDGFEDKVLKCNQCHKAAAKKKDIEVHIKIYIIIYLKYNIRSSPIQFYILIIFMSSINAIEIQV